VGQSVNLADLAPFVDVSRQKIKKKLVKSLNNVGVKLDDEKINHIVEERVRDIIKDGVQTIQYQLLTLLTTNGQTPFVTVFMYLNEIKDQRLKDDYALIIEEVIRQRYKGVKNEEGVYITPAFPKLIYVLEEDNFKPGTKYFYLTKLALQCTAKRLVPDYISEKVMKEIKDGYVYSSMGCVDGQEIITYKFNDKLYVEAFERMWSRFSLLFPVKHQYDDINNPNLYMDLLGVQIYDTARNGFTNVYRLIRNISNKWCDINLSNGRRLLCTADHPFETNNRGVVFAEKLQQGDSILINRGQYSEEKYNINPELAWTLGFMICDGCYQGATIVASIAAENEDEIEQRFINNLKMFFDVNIESDLKERGNKGTYKDLMSRSQFKGEVQKLQQYFISMFGGVNKLNRQIPNEVFEWSYSSKLAFMAGMIDADGYINNSPNNPTVQIGSTNKELALQQMALAQAMGMPASMYHNHYNSRNPESIRYRIEFVPTSDLINFVCCGKKINNFVLNPVSFQESRFNNISQVVSVRPIYKTDYSYDVTTESEHFEVSGIYSHNCRSFLAPWYDQNGNVKFWGRGNMGVVTINLPHVAMSSDKDYDKFWKLFDERLELCHEALLCRYKRLKGTKSDVAPIMWQYGAIARLKKGETIDKLLVGGYTSISLGYAGLYECVKFMTGKSHTDPLATPFAIEIMNYMNSKVAEWTKQDNLGYSIYGTPIESTTYKFAKSLQSQFGIVEGVSDKNYITNSYHVNVREEIDAYSKLGFEAQFQKLSSGGSISYVEIPNIQDNPEALESLAEFLYDHNLYAEFNSKSDFCHICGFDGEIQIVTDEETGKLVWECPICKNRDQDKMNVARRTCGYIGSQFWNQGRTEEIKDRVLHL
jgi:anaerobic ribonucleoside-triphosphate reductase